MKKIICLLTVSLFLAASVFSQDVIYKKDNTKIEGKVTKITEAEIEYKKASQLNGPIRVISISNVHQIVYSDGSFEIFQADSIVEEEKPSAAVEEKKEVSIKKEETKLQLPEVQQTMVEKPIPPTASFVSSSLISKNKVRLQFVDERINPYNFGKVANGVTWIPIKMNKNDRKNVIMPMFTRMMTSEFKKSGFFNSQEIPDFTLKVILTDIYYETTDKFTKMMFYQRCKVKYILENNSTEDVLFAEEVFADHNGQANEIRRMKLKGFDFFYFSLSKNASKLFKETDFESLFE